MEIFNIFSISEPFKTGASGSGIGIPYTIQYNMSVMGTELDGTRYIRNYGKGGNSFNAEALASNHIYLNGKSVPYPTLHTLGSEISDDPTMDNDSAWFKSSSAVTVSGGSATWDGTDAGTPYLRDDTVTLPIGTPCLVEVIVSGYVQGTVEVTLGTSGVSPLISANGTHYFNITSGGSADKFYITGRTSFQGSVELCSIKGTTLPTLSYFTYFSSTPSTLTELSSTGDRGATLPISTIYSVTDSHQFVFNHTAPLEDIDVIALEADPLLAFRMFFDGEPLPSGFSNTDVGWFSGGNEGLASAEKVYDLSDQAFLTYVSIVDYDAATRTTLANQSNGASNLKLVQDGSGRTTGTAAANTTQWKADGRTAVTNWTIAAPFTITEIIGVDTYTFTSDLNRYKNGIADGTFTAVTGTWTLDEFGFDGVTSVTARGVTRMIDEVVIP